MGDVTEAEFETSGDIKTTRPRWHNKMMFVIACVGSCLGMGNIWKYPYLAYKHGGPGWLIAYMGSMFLVGIPMLILEFTLGQKMQRGSAGALRGITPRLAGAGWAASFAGFVTCVIYNILMGLVLVYLHNAGSQPWNPANYKRSPGCSTAEKAGVSAAELFLYRDVTKVFDPTSCAVY